MKATDSVAHSGIRNWQVGLTIVLVGIVLYGPSLNDGFHFDDELIVNDSNVTNSERWGHFLNPLYLRQVTFFTFYLNYQIGGENPFGYHIVNVAIHIGNAYLLYRLLALMAAGWIAPAAALIFLAHPIQTESVVYVYQRSTLLATFFALVALIVIAESDERRGFRVLAASVLFLLAFESKESALAMPLLIVLVIGLKNRLALGIGFAVSVLGAAALGVLARLEESTVGIGAATAMGPGTYFLTQVKVLYLYLRLLVVPYPQSLEYDVEAVGSIFHAPVLSGLAGLMVMVSAAGWLVQHARYRWAGLGAASFFILLLPTSSVIPSLDFAFEHRLYMPMLGFAVFAAFWLARLDRRTIVLLLVVVPLGGLTLNRGRAWASSGTRGWRIRPWSR